MRINDAVLGVAMIAGAAAIIASSLGFPNVPGQQFGPRHFPILIASGFAICGALLIAQGVRRRRSVGEAWVSVGEWLQSPRHIASVLLVIGGILVYWIAAPILGFIPTACAILFVLMRWLGGSWLGSAVIAAAATAAIHVAFYSWLRVSLPLGLMRDVIY